MSPLYHVIADPELQVEQFERARPCPECADTLAERQIRGDVEDVVCLGCGKVLTHSEKGLRVKLESSQTKRERDEEIAQLRREGFRTREIAERYGITDQRVSQISQRMGVGLARNASIKFAPSDVVKAIRAFRKKNGYWPRWDDWKVKNRKPSASVAIRCFGGWKAAVDAAKNLSAQELARLDAERGGDPRYDEQGVLEALRNFYEREGHWPTSKEWRNQRLTPSASFIERHWGWGVALEAAAKKFASKK